MNKISSLLLLIRKRPYAVASIAWAGLLIAFFYPVLFHGAIIAPLDILDHLMRPWSDGSGGFGVHNAFVYDAISQYLPYDWAVYKSLAHDGYIGWNQWCFGGYALLENTMLCPGDWHHQLYRVLDFWTAWDLGIILQFAIAGFGVLTMLRAEKVPAWAALIAAMAFAFYSQHILWIYHRWVLGASCWFPWIIWSVRHARRRGHILGVSAIIFTTLAFRGGHLQACLFTATLVACLFVSDVISRKTEDSPLPLWRIFCFYSLIAIFSSILSADVFLNTIPAFLDGCKDMPSKSWAQSLLGIPTLVTALIPKAFGTPQSLDAFKAFGKTLFDLKYLGCIPFVFACLALPKRDAPRLPKILFVVGLVTAFTPLDRWFYSRSTVIFCLGAVWLAAWQIANLSSITRKQWKWIKQISAIALLAWIVASVAVLALTPKITPTLHNVVARLLPAEKATRHDWMLSRADSFLTSFPPWSEINLPLIGLAALGLVVAWKISVSITASRRTRIALISCVVLCVFGELFVLSRSYVTFSEKPETTDSLYTTPDWAVALRSEMHDEGLLYVHRTRPDFDYLQINAQAGIDIASIQGYETIRPKTLQIPNNAVDYDPESFAESGISHVLVLPEETPPQGLSVWIDSINTPALHLYRNPAFKSRWQAITADGSSIPLQDTATSPNKHVFSLPRGTISVCLAEPFHKSWTDTLLNIDNPPLIQSSLTNNGGTRITFETPLETPGTLIRTFRKRNFFLYPQLALVVGLAALGVCRKHRNNAERKTP